MSIPAPHYLLFSEARQTAEWDSRAARKRGQWRFVLEDVDGRQSLEAAESEPDTVGERLELLAVVRGLEALDQPSRVTLITASRYVTRGIRFGLNAWRENGWRWEEYGRYSPVNNDDLWKRIDRAMTFHQVKCRTWRFDQAHTAQPSADEKTPESHPVSRDSKPLARPASSTGRRKHWATRLVSRVSRALRRV